MFSFFKRSNSKQSKNKTNRLETERAFILKNKKKGIGLKSTLIEAAALSRNFEVNRLSKRIILVKNQNGIEYGFVHMNGAHSSRIGKILCDRKQDTRYLLQQNNIAVVESKVFSYKNYTKAIKYVEKLGFPLVVKPTALSRGRGITTNIRNLDEFEIAWNKGFDAYKKNKRARRLLIEKHFQGEDFRFFVVGDKVVSVTQRKRANIVGNGSSTVLELLQMKNVKRKENPYLANYPIPEDIQELDVLKRKNIKLDFIPEKGEEITLRSQSNLSAGGDSIDMTDIAHPNFKKIAVNAVKAIPGIEYAGVDFITTDITRAPNPTNYIVGEVEYSPAPLAHFPLVGKSRDMAGAIIDYYMNKRK